MEKKSSIQSYLLPSILLAASVALFLPLFPSIKKSVFEIKESIFQANIYRLSNILEASAVSTKRSVRLNNYNNWHFLTKPTDDTLANKLATVSKFQELTYTESWDVKGVTTQAIKSLNPEIKLYRLYTLNVKPTWDSDWNNPQDLSHLQFPLTKAQIDSNGWWMKDGNGNIVKENDNVWFIDVGKPGVKEAFLQSVLDRNRNKGFDGFVFDYWWPGMVSNWITNKGLPPPADYPNDDVWFTKAWQPFINYVMSGLRNDNYTIIGNSAGEYGASNSKLQFQRSLIDGAVYEQGSIDWNGDWLSGSIIETRINSLSGDPLNAWIGTYGLKNTDPLFNQKKLVDLSMYYVSLPSDPALQQKRSYHYYNDGNIFWDPLWDFDIGTPAEDRIKVSGKYAWSRKYTNGLVLLNYGVDLNDTNSQTFTLDKEYVDLAENTYSGSVTLPAHTAMILKIKSITNRPPDISFVPSRLIKNEGDTIAKSEIEKATDPDGDSLTYTYSFWLTSLPYTISYTDAGSHVLHVVVSDGKGGAAVKNVVITVTNVNRVPDVSAIPATLTKNKGDTIAKSEIEKATDPDGDPLTYTYSNWLTSLPYTISYTDAGTHTLHVVIADGKGGTASKDINVTINDVTNRPPDLSAIPSSLTKNEGETITKAEIEKATDPDGDPLTYTYSGWLTSLPYTISYTDAGTHTLHVAVADGKGGTAPKDISVTINDVDNTPLVIEELLAKIAQLQVLIAGVQAQISQIQGLPEIPAEYKFVKPLYPGLKSIDVRYLQIFLKSQGPEIYSKGLITGYFGLLTKTAVINFQVKQKIIASAYSRGAGLVGPKTRAKINEILGR